MEPALYIVATPIGNLSDITERALEVLAGCSVVAAEDTRRTGQLLRGRDIATPMTPYHEHNAERATLGLLSRLENGEAVALVSDAGTPTISDPGYRLVRAVQDAGYRVVAFDYQALDHLLEALRAQALDLLTAAAPSLDVGVEVAQRLL